VHAQHGTDGLAIGLVGQGARVISKRLPEVLAQRPRYVIVQAGVNDLASGRSLKHTQTWLAKMHAEVRAAGARVVAVPVLPWAAYLDRRRFRPRKRALLRDTRALNAWLAREHAAGRIDVLVDVSELDDGHGRLKAGFARRDGLHLNAAGQTQLGRLIAAQIRTR
jgi:lysophospholipase L1-like esterase